MSEMRGSEGGEEYGKSMSEEREREREREREALSFPLPWGENIHPSRAQLHLGRAIHQMGKGERVSERIRRKNPRASAHTHTHTRVIPKIPSDERTIFIIFKQKQKKGISLSFFLPQRACEISEARVRSMLDRPLRNLRRLLWSASLVRTWD